MTLKALIIDDEPLARDLLRNYCDQTGFIETAGVCASPAEAVKQVVSGKLDVIFLDINMPYLNGIEFANIVPQNTKIVYVTAYDQYAVKGFRTGALDYILKPVSFADFLTAAKRALEWKQMRLALAETQNYNRTHILIKSDYKMIQVPLDNITFIEGKKDYITINLDCEPYSVLSLISMKHIKQLLPKHKFIRVHRSFIVNTEKVTLIERNNIIFGKTAIPISDTYRDEYHAFVQERTANIDDPGLSSRLGKPRIRRVRGSK